MAIKRLWGGVRAFFLKNAMVGAVFTIQNGTKQKKTEKQKATKARQPFQKRHLMA